jgi:hypothetical protein
MNDYDLTSHSPAGEARRPGGLRLLSKKKGGWIVAAGLTGAVATLVGAGTSASAVSSSASSSTSSASATPTAAPSATPTGGGPRSGPADGGATGLVDTTSASGFTLTTATGVVVNVDETSATKTHGAPARAVKKGTSVLVLGLVNAPLLGTSDPATITAAQVIVQPRGDGGAAAAAAAGVVASQRGVPSPVKTVGQVPSGYTEGDGTIVSGTAAYKAAKNAQALYPGGIVDRVVKLSDGEYEVHNITIAWPHHVFVNKDFKVVGAF